MTRLVANLLDMIRVETGSLGVHREWNLLSEIVGVALIRTEDQLRGHRVTTAIPPDLPLVPVDDVLLEQVFVNLLENAARHTPAGTPVEIAAAARDTHEVEVAVADRGPGIPAGEEERVFEKFHRAGSTLGSGVGLGLTICRGIVTAHGGRMWAEGRAGGGAVFRFTIPIVGTPPTIAPEGEAESRPEDGLAVDAPPLILLIEDEPQMRRFLRAALGALDYRLVEAETAKDGLAQAAARNPDVILLDLGLPDRDGLEVTRDLRGWTSTPIIVLSARGREQDKVAALDLGADDYLTKPFGVEELLARIRVALRHAALPAGAAPEPLFTAGELQVDLVRRVVKRNGTEVHLTPTEYKLLTLLIRHAGKVMTHRQLLEGSVGDQLRRAVALRAGVYGPAPAEAGAGSGQAEIDRDGTGRGVSAEGRVTVRLDT